MDAHPDLTTNVIIGLGWFYLLMAAMNAFWAYRVYQRGQHFERLLGFEHIPRAATWALYATLLLVVAIAHLTTTASPDEFMLRLPLWFKNSVDWVIANPVRFFVLSIILFVAMIVLRKWWTRPTVAWILLNISMLFLAVSMTDSEPPSMARMFCRLTRSPMCCTSRVSR